MLQCVNSLYSILLLYLSYKKWEGRISWSYTNSWWENRWWFVSSSDPLYIVCMFTRINFSVQWKRFLLDFISTRGSLLFFYLAGEDPSEETCRTWREHQLHREGSSSGPGIEPGTLLCCEPVEFRQCRLLMIPSSSQQQQCVCRSLCIRTLKSSGNIKQNDSLVKTA